MTELANCVQVKKKGFFCTLSSSICTIREILLLILFLSVRGGALNHPVSCAGAKTAPSRIRKVGIEAPPPIRKSKSFYVCT